MSAEEQKFVELRDSDIQESVASCNIARRRCSSRTVYKENVLIDANGLGSRHK